MGGRERRLIIRCELQWVGEFIRAGAKDEPRHTQRYSVVLPKSFLTSSGCSDSASGATGIFLVKRRLAS